MHEVTTDVLVVGAGPAGVAAACAAAERGRAVIVLDDNAVPGGQIWRQGKAPTPAPAARPWVERLRRSGAEVHGGSSVVDSAGAHVLYVQRGDSPVRYRAAATILATGARELLLPFPGWTLPGVFGAGGLQALAKGGWPIAEQRIVVAGSGPLLLAVADYLTQAGARVVALVEQAARGAMAGVVPALLRQPAKLRQAGGFAWRLRGVRQLHGHWPVRAEGADSVEALVVTNGTRERRLECDLVACGFGLVPETMLAALLGATIRDGRVAVGDDQQTSVAGLYAVGELTGVGGVDVALMEGLVAGSIAAGDTAAAGRYAARRDREGAFAGRMTAAFALRPEVAALAAADTIVCRCEDVPWGAVRGYSDARDAKLKTRCGMGPCQGRVCGPALRLMKGWSHDRVRPPLFPIPTAALAQIGAAQTTEAQR